MGSVNPKEFPSLTSFPRADQVKIDDQLLQDHKLTREEFRSLVEILGRSPTFAELGVFSSMWSEHCSYKSSKLHLKRFPTTGKNVVVGPGENAGVVRLSGKLCVAFKMESHNHPSYIEPYQGAATGVGGILRDVFCMGARPVANLNCLRFGEVQHPRTPYLVDYVVKGIGDYGNCVGIPTVGGNVSRHESYDGNCLVNAMTIGTIHEDRIFKGFASGAGNLVVYLGSATGRDGVHGATMASDSFATKDEDQRSAVQVGDPFTEKLLLEATLEILDKGLVVGLQDMGAAGLTSSSFEMADRAKSGLRLDLDRVPVRTQSLSAYELMLSESQERMLLVVKAENWQELCRVLEKWDLACTVIGVVTNTGRIEATYKGQLEVDIPVAEIVSKAPVYDRPMRPRATFRTSEGTKTLAKEVEQRVKDSGVEATLSRMLFASGDKTPIYRQYDSHIGTKTVFGPEQQGGASLWLRSEWAESQSVGLVAAAAGSERYCRVDPKAGASLSVLKAARMVAAAGGEPLAITDCLNYGNPEIPEVMWEFSEGVDGISHACRELEIPVVSGNVSFYNETDGKSIAPTPMIGMVGKLANADHANPAVVTSPGTLLLIHPKSVRPAFGGSLLAHVFSIDDSHAGVPSIDWEAEKEALAFFRRNSAKISVARDVGAGGILTTLAKMLLPGGYGCRLNLDGLRGVGETLSEQIFGELNPCFLLMLRNADAPVVGMPFEHLDLITLGTVDQTAKIVFDGGSTNAPSSVELSRGRAYSAYVGAYDTAHESWH